MNKTVKKVAKTILPDSIYGSLRDKKIKKTYKKRCDLKVQKFHNNFREIMFESKISDSFDRTITPSNIKLIDKNGADGITCELRFPKGLSIDSIDKAKNVLAQNVYGKCMVFVENQHDAPVKFSAIKKWHNVKYKPLLGLNASQLFLGYTIDLEPIIIDMAKYPHLLITGGTGGGKSKVVEIIMSNLSFCCDPSELNLYYLQLSKDDNFKYELLNHCRGCVTATSCDTKLETYKKAYNMLKYIEAEMRRREKLVKERLGRESEDINIHIYNKTFSDKLPVLQLWVDEAATLYKKDSNKDINKMLDEMRFIVEQIASAGRYIGIYLVNVMQRASKEEMPREIKINTMNWVSFNQVDAGACKVAIGDETSAVGLPQRVFVVKAGGQSILKFAKTPFSAWDKNVNMLRSSGRVRVGTPDMLSAILDVVYSEWDKLDKVADAQPSNLPNNSKIISNEIAKLQGEVLNYRSLVDNLKNQLQEMKEERMYNSVIEDKDKDIEEVKKVISIEDRISEYVGIGNHKIVEKVNFLNIPTNPAISKRVMKKE